MHGCGGQPARSGERGSDENRMSLPDPFSSFATRLQTAFFPRELPAQAPPFAAWAVELFRLQFDANPAYRRFCESRGCTPARTVDWTAIPCTPTRAFKEFELTCLPPPARTTVFHSSGTTGHQPGRHFHSAGSLALYEASLWPWFRRHLLAEDEPPAALDWLALTPSPALAPHSSLVHMFAVVLRESGAEAGGFLGKLGPDGAWVLRPDAVGAALHRAARIGRPVGLLGTAFSFVHLLDALEARGEHVRLPPGSRLMETGGYKGRSRSLPKKELHRCLSERLDIPPSHLVCEYGMSELGSQAYDGAISATPGSTLPLPERRFRFPPWSQTRVVSPETGDEVRDGQTGLLQVWDLVNVWSVMAIQTEDLAVRRGDGFELMGRAAAAEPRGCSLTAV
jgi:hypothetical protein